MPDEVIRHARKDHVPASFIENVWTEVGRCAKDSLKATLRFLENTEVTLME